MQINFFSCKLKTPFRQNNYNKFYMVIALYGKVINKQLDFKGENYSNPACNTMNTTVNNCLTGKEQRAGYVNY